MATFNLFNSFKEELAEAGHNLGSDTLRIALSNTAPVATNTVLSNITQISSAGGYTPLQATQVSSAQTSGTYKLTLTDTTFTASGAAFDAFRYVVVYNDTSATDKLIGWYDYGSSITLAAGESMAVDFDGTNGTLTLA